jgi:hypothetical protein
MSLSEDLEELQQLADNEETLYLTAGQMIQRNVKWYIRRGSMHAEPLYSSEEIQRVFERYGK